MSEGKCSPFPKCQTEWLSAEQNKAVDLIGSYPLSILNGPPGVGKTRTTVEIVRLAQEAGQSILCCAPTGKAASRIAEALGEGGLTLRIPPRTIHRALEWMISEDNQNGFPRRNKQQPLNVDLIICDESSMIDLPLMAALFDAIDPGTRVVFVGDANQLPPVGPGQPFIDMINSGQIPTCTLVDIWRQAQGSKIWLACQAIMEQSPYDFYRYATRDGDEIAFNALESSDRIKSFFRAGIIGFHGNPADLQILTPVREKGPASAVALNQLASHLLNPIKTDSMELSQAGLGRPGDRIIQMKNDYMRGVFNGEQGIIRTVDQQKIMIQAKKLGKRWVQWSRWPHANENPQEMKVLGADFGDQYIPYTEGESSEQLSLAYALTIHRFQGSESPHVAIALPVEAWGMAGRRLLLTAVSRARKRAVLAGPVDVLTKAITTDRDARRRSGLMERIR